MNILAMTPAAFCTTVHNGAELKFRQKSGMRLIKEVTTLQSRLDRSQTLVTDKSLIRHAQVDSNGWRHLLDLPASVLLWSFNGCGFHCPRIQRTAPASAVRKANSECPTAPPDLPGARPGGFRLPVGSAGFGDLHATNPVRPTGIQTPANTDSVNGWSVHCRRPGALFISHGLSSSGALSALTTAD
jgi:hypothetical protein